MTTLTFFGLKNCDTCRKAMKWLDANGIDYHYHDVRADGLTEATVRGWLDAHDWPTVVNRRSTTWRTIPAGTRDEMDATSAVQAIVAAPTLAKRPVLMSDDFIEIGFDTDRYRELLSV